MKTFDIDTLTAVELPERHVMAWIVVVLDVNHNVVNVLSFNDIAAALNACGIQVGGVVVGINQQTQTVTCQSSAQA